MLLYFSGMYIGNLMKSKKTISLWLLFIPLIAQVGQMVFYKCIDTPFIHSTYNPVRDLCYSSLAITLSFVLAYIFEVVKSSRANKLFSFLGSISLESYLWNTYLGYCLCMAIEKHVSIVAENKMLFYLFICALGLLMSKPYQNIINRIKK